MKVTKLLRVARNVRALERAAAFYSDVLGFESVGPAREDAALAGLLNVKRVRVLQMRLGAQEIALSECFPVGEPYPAEARSNALCFQHIAMLTTDIAAAYARVKQAGAMAISENGPVKLPASSGSVIAFKFRDPDGHPLEFLQFPKVSKKPPLGFDHSAISVSNVKESVAFYGRIGLSLNTKQINRGAEQDALDGLQNATVDVVALTPIAPTPHVELLCYRTPKAGRMVYAPAAICADRLVFESVDRGLSLMRDPDGHVVLLDGR